MTDSNEYINIITDSNESVNIKLKKGERNMVVNKQKLYIAMANHCITSNELQTKSGLPRGTFLKVVTGKSVRPATIGKIAKALNVPVENLIDMGSGE